MDEINEYEVTSINDYLDGIFRIEDNDPSEEENKQEFLYRGQGNKEWDLLPAIARGEDNKYGRHLLSQEAQIIETAKHRLPHIFKDTLQPVDLLALLQHYGLPTRLLDVTLNPLVGLYFACQHMDSDGEVIVFQHDADDITNYPIANAVADSYRLLNLNTTRLRTYYQNAARQSYFFEESTAMRKGINSCEKWKHLLHHCTKELIFVHAQEQLERQRRQQGQFIIFSNEVLENGFGYNEPYFEFSIKPIAKDGRFVRARFIIPRELKSTIQGRLKLLGFSEGTLFEDSVDAVCRQITNDARKRIQYFHAVG